MNAAVTTPRTIRLHADDNVVIAVDLVAAGAVSAGITARERILRGHKMAVAAIPEGAPVRKFGQIIGFAKVPIGSGEWVHEHNVGMHEFDRDSASARMRATTICSRRSCARHSRAIAGLREEPARATTSGSSPR